ncbi:ABC transporter permease [Clavibacter michiganensis subsp. michiganensis]|uniref:ABC transporter permease n=1 Tax=Clavibacter michiganensis TaxID=28447 RepID=UPI000A37E9E3|nr:ABC transporter permease [Clavibacter michiganensis]MDO4099308.1 ABC transporter permease [Clavibacter michiganensis]OUE26514.1 Ribose transport system permease protein RbsC [Clavibacter michiganensis subsp. michiganensis]QXP04644.1 ABC transporter permease [Clavibacter michiganensis subsp. michiganensis]
MTSTSTSAPAAAKGARTIDFGRYTQLLGLVAVIALLAVVFQLTNPAFLTVANTLEVLRSATLYFIVACPVTLIIVAGGLDLSVGALYALGAVSGGLLMLNGVPWSLALLAGVLVGAGTGYITGAMSVFLGIPSLIASLATFFVASGVAVVLTGGRDVFGFPDGFTAIGSGSLFGVPNLIYIAVAIGIVFHLLLEHTPFGYNVRATGGNRAAAMANGIRVKRVDLILFATSGGIAALAGLLGASRIFAASPLAGGNALTFQVLTAIIIGGTSLFGGIGTITGSALGALLFGIINNGLATSGVNPLFQNIFIGIILAVAVAVDQFRRSRRFKAGRG